MILAKPGDWLLFLRIFIGADDVLHPPLVAGCRAEHTAHQMIVAVRMGKGMQGIEFIHSELLGGDKNGSTGTKGNVTHTLSNCACSHRCCRIITGACRHLDGCGNAEFLCDFFFHRTHTFIAFKQLWQHIHTDAADLTHFLGPAAILYIKEQHTGSVGYIRAMYPGQFISDIILRKHYLCYSGKIFRLLILHPQNLGCGETGKGYVCCIFRKLILSDYII